MSRIEDIMLMAPVIPVLVIEDVSYARPIAEALVAGGLPVLDVTLHYEPASPTLAELFANEAAALPPSWALRTHAPRRRQGYAPALCTVAAGQH